MNVRYRVELTDAERSELREFLGRGKGPVRKLKRAQILLAADKGESDKTIAANVCVGTSTVFRTKRRFVEGNLERALGEKPRPGASRKLSAKEEALLVATACSAPPRGRARWTLELLAEAMVALTDLETLSDETVRRRLAENELKPWRKEMWIIPKVNAGFVAKMEDVLDLYSSEHDPLRPVVSFDESPTQLIGEVREPIPAAPGQLERVDAEYRRNGTVNLFIFLDVHRPWRHVKVTSRRTAIDFAACMRDLVDVHYPDAECVRVVMDNLSTHSAGALYEAFEPDEARRILRRLEFHFVPKHASWLNMVEIEIGVLRGQCLDRRIDNRPELEAEIQVWEQARNEAGVRVEWMFTTEKARQKMASAYPSRVDEAPTKAASDLAKSANCEHPMPDEPESKTNSTATEKKEERMIVQESTAQTRAGAKGAASKQKARRTPTGPKTRRRGQTLVRPKPATKPRTRTGAAAAGAGSSRSATARRRSVKTTVGRH